MSECYFYSVGSLIPAGLELAFELEVEQIVYRMPKVLLAARITLRRLDGCMPQQEFNLL